MSAIVLDQIATTANFNEEAYLAANPDVAAAVASKIIPSGRLHFERYGKSERRSQRASASESMLKLQARKLARIEPLFRTDIPFMRRGQKRDYLSDALRAETGIGQSVGISANGYDAYGMALIEETKEGIVLDCGAGKRPVYFDNVVNFEIFDYDTTDVIGVGEELPFIDGAFDAVISIAVLEHVRDPFRCAQEICRVLKPGGKLLCCVPFLQPEHGYPHHYYNMAPQGLRALFDRKLVIDDHKVIEPIGPVWALRWILESWRNGLSGLNQAAFLSLSVADILSSSQPDREPWVTALDKKKQFELACATMLFAHKAPASIIGRPDATPLHTTRHPRKR